MQDVEFLQARTLAEHDAVQWTIRRNNWHARFVGKPANARGLGGIRYHVKEPQTGGSSAFNYQCYSAHRWLVPPQYRI